MRPRRQDHQLEDRAKEEECRPSLALGVNHTNLWKTQDQLFNASSEEHRTSIVEKLTSILVETMRAEDDGAASGEV